MLVYATNVQMPAGNAMYNDRGTRRLELLPPDMPTFVLSRSSNHLNAVLHCISYIYLGYVIYLFPSLHSQYNVPMACGINQVPSFRYLA
ncbi:uncharacterized protein BT62DRAFT_599607 [Guyanagaster necrorhizus]|uniref:Uncharacterized protein n=1 Tax=Guyanagaster necrorhizus TaxID=856835 RepID=A0A9P8AVL2_9AGAR|nr:uncharacterized protein BT62DRAFT_599607 [Guyanagaster necrorhizus MCA 3950]KAG7449658.1 hypothetical protein BT62DRAFT_599607 [Guyanagaster necrorhizus MCA 3950]